MNMYMTLTYYEKYHLYDHVHTKSDVETKIEQLKTLILDKIAKKKQYITIWAEENGNITSGNFEWSFGNGTENQPNYGYCMPTSGRIKAASLSASANGSAPADIYVRVIINGVENTKYTISKPTQKFSHVTPCKKPINLNVGDIINFKSHSTNGSVTHALVSLLIEIDM